MILCVTRGMYGLWLHGHSSHLDFLNHSPLKISLSIISLIPMLTPLLLLVHPFFFLKYKHTVTGEAGKKKMGKKETGRDSSLSIYFTQLSCHLISLALQFVNHNLRLIKSKNDHFGIFVHLLKSQIRIMIQK